MLLSLFNSSSSTFFKEDDTTMKYASILLLSLVVVLAVSGPVAAHRFGPNGEGNPWFMPAIPDQVIPRFDGDLSDWAWFPTRWTFRPDDFISMGNFNTAEQAVPKDDWDFILYGPAWIPAMNMVTWALTVTDNIMYAPHADLQLSWQMDGGQFAIDADHGGEAKNEFDYQQSYWTVAQGGNVGIFGNQEVAWAYEEPHIFFGMTIQPNGSYEGEFAAHIWDRLDPGGPSTSRLHQLEDGQIIGFSVELYDMDSDTEQEFPDAEFDFGNVAIGGEVLGDYFLLPVEETLAALVEEDRPLPSAVEASTWGRIKSTFTR
jgi:hypothetical protein